MAKITLMMFNIALPEPVVLVTPYIFLSIIVAFNQKQMWKYIWIFFLAKYMWIK